MTGWHHRLNAYEFEQTPEDEMAGWHHRLNAHEFEQTPGDSGGQRSLAGCSPWGHKQSDTTLRLNNNEARPWAGAETSGSVSLSAKGEHNTTKSIVFERLNPHAFTSIHNSHNR